MAAAQQTGLVNVQVGDRTIQDVGVGVAANVVALLCGIQVNAAVIADQVILNQAPLVRSCEQQGEGAEVVITQ
jgi:hypothetical protein